jgi:hypothetical protein
MMEAARTSETSVDNYFARQYIPEDNSELHNCRRENLKSHKCVTDHSFLFEKVIAGDVPFYYTKAKAVLLHVKEALEWRGDIAPTHSRLLH